MSKFAAVRPKDREFNLLMLRAGLVDTSQALQLPLTAAAGQDLDDLA